MSSPFLPPAPRGWVTVQPAGRRSRAAESVRWDWSVRLAVRAGNSPEGPATTGTGWSGAAREGPVRWIAGVRGWPPAVGDQATARPGSISIVAWWIPSRSRIAR